MFVYIHFPPYTHIFFNFFINTSIYFLFLFYYLSSIYRVLASLVTSFFKNKTLLCHFRFGSNVIFCFRRYSGRWNLTGVSLHVMHQSDVLACCLCFVMASVTSVPHSRRVFAGIWSKVHSSGLDILSFIWSPVWHMDAFRGHFWCCQLHVWGVRYQLFPMSNYFSDIDSSSDVGDEDLFETMSQELRWSNWKCVTRYAVFRRYFPLTMRTPHLGWKPCIQLGRLYLMKESHPGFLSLWFGSHLIPV